MRPDESLVVNPDFVYNQYDQPVVPDPNIIITTGGTAVTTINSASGPIITITGGSTGLTFSSGSATVSMAGTLVAANGGTGNASYTKGDILAASAATTLTKLAVGTTTGQVLSVDPTAGTGLAWITGEVILASTSLNLNTNTKQTLYTVPSGKSAIVTKVVLRSASTDLSAGSTTRLSFGFNAGATDFGVGLFDPRILTASTLYSVFSQEFASPSGVSVIGTTTQTFGVITDVAFSSAATVIIEVYGHLF